MLKHNLILFLRTIKRSKSTFLINIVGLSSGMTCVLLITLWISDELNVDKFNQKDEQLFQVMQNISSEKGIETTEGTPGPLAKAMPLDLPEIEFSTTVIPTVFNTCNGIISVEGERHNSIAQYASVDFFNVFSYKLLDGDKNKVLSDKNGIVISRELAQRLFQTSDNDVLGRPIEWSVQDIKVNGYVSGVFENVPNNATNQFDLVLNYELFLDYRPWFKEWAVNGPRTYLRLAENSPIETFNSKITNYLESKIKNTESVGTLFSQQYSDRYLYGNYTNGAPSEGRMSYIKLFGLIALFILIIACINFTNLSTANASIRTKELGIKKAIGAGRGVLIVQYLFESILMAFFSLLVAVILALTLLEPFNYITGKEIVFNFDPFFIFSIVLITLFTGILAGSYPALYLSGLNTVSILKGKIGGAKSETWARKGLVIFQFSISIILIVAVFIVYKQIEFVQSTNLGYDKNQVVHFRVENPTDGLILEIKNIPGVVDAGGIFHEIASSSEPVTVRDVSWKGSNPNNKIDFVNLTIGYGFIETLGIQISDGRSFSKDFGSGKHVICNESAIQSMGIQDPIGKKIRINDEEREIVGVSKDFHFESLHKPVKPCLLLLSETSGLPKVMVKIQAGTEKRTIENLGNLFKETSPKLPFDYKFLDQDYQALYSSEERVATLSKYFAGLAILISCLGLFALATFTAERRRKEIGVRKVLGQNPFQITFMLTSEFAKPILIANLIALPIAYFLVSNWLSSFAFKISLQLWYFLAAGIAALTIAMLTVGSQALRAAHKDPIEVLREE